MAKAIAIPASPALQEKIKEDGAYKTVFKYARKKQGLYETIVNWIIDWRYRSKRVNLKEWINTLPLPQDCIDHINKLRHIKDNDIKIRQILHFVNKNIQYKGDLELWKVAEKWQTPEETWMTRKGDCEDGAILIYCMANKAGIDDSRIRITTSDVVGGGHCYVVYRANDLLEYPIDWCYWFSIGIKMKIPYVLRTNYFSGRKEWFSFNKTSAYKSK